jgi:ArsR family transcriptional regulator
MTIDARGFERIAKALAEPRRVEILRLISERPGITCTEVVNAIEVGQSTVSHHLKELFEADLVTGVKEGQCIRLTSNPAALRAFVDSLNPLAQP